MGLHICIGLYCATIDNNIESLQMLELRYGDRAEIHPGPSEVVVFEEDTISLQLKNGDLAPSEGIVEKNGWRLTPKSKMEVSEVNMYDCQYHPSVSIAQVSRKEVTSFAPPEKTNPHLLHVEWAGEGEPTQRLVQKVVLKGSENSKSLTISHPLTICKCGMMSERMQ